MNPQTADSRICAYCETTIPEPADGVLPDCPKCGRKRWAAVASWDSEKHRLKEGKRTQSMTRTLFDADGQFVPAFLAERIMAKYSVRTNPEDEELYVWNQETGLFELGTPMLKEMAQEHLGQFTSSHRVKEAIEFVKRATYNEMLEPAVNLLPVENGVLDLDKGILLNYTSDDFFTAKLPVRFDSAADCPEVKQFMAEILPSETDQENAWEIIAYCLLRAHPIQKGVMLIGEGSNGKSVFLGIVNSLLGPENCTNISLQNLCENRFSLIHLHRKYANIFADLPANPLKWLGYFKLLTGGDMIGGEKKFGGFVNFRNYAKLLFSCNQLPNSYDDTDAFYRRWLLMNFPMKFEGDRRDPKKIEKVTSSSELSGILNIALAKLKLLLQRGDFTATPTTNLLREQYLRKSNPTAGFIIDCLEEEPEAGAFVEKGELYRAFVQYCQDQKLPTPSQTVFTKELKRQIPTIAEERKGSEGERFRVFTGINLKKNVHDVHPVHPCSSINENVGYTIGCGKEGEKTQEREGGKFNLDRRDGGQGGRVGRGEALEFLRWMSTFLSREVTEVEIEQGFGSGAVAWWSGFDDWLDQMVKTGDISRPTAHSFKLVRYTEEQKEG